jgi:hypothetical protein
MKRTMLRRIKNGEIVGDVKALRMLTDEFEPVEVELHRLLYRTDAAGVRYDRFGNCLDVEEAMPPPKRSKVAKKVAAQVSLDDLEVPL